MSCTVTDLIIDVHAHYLPRSVLERFDEHRRSFPSVEIERSEAGARLAFAGGEPTRPISPKLFDLEDRKKWMDKNGIDHQLVGGWLDSFGYELPAAEGATWSRYLNHCMLDGVAGEPRFTALATVPLQDGALAAEVLAECWDQGFGGVMIGTLPQGLGGVLDGPDLDPFWEKADALGAAVFLHPMFLCGEPRLADFDLVNALGRIADTSIAVSRLLYSGHLLRYKNLKLVISHGGAALPMVMGRLHRNFVISQGKYADPRKGFDALFFDSVVFDQAALRLLMEYAEGRVMLGSDMPFPIGDPEPRKVIEDGGCFDEAQRKAMLSETARAVFRLRADRGRRTEISTTAARCWRPEVTEVSHPLDWPRFDWNRERLAEPLAAVRHRQGRLIGHMEALGFNLRQEAVLQTLTADVLKSSEIEGEKLDAEQVRSSIARRLGMDIGALKPADRNVEGIVEMMLDATRHYDQPLTAERLFAWHASLFPTGRSGMTKIRAGAWRDDSTGPMQVVSGPVGKEHVHFEAPPAATARRGNEGIPGLVQRKTPTSIRS